MGRKKKGGRPPQQPIRGFRPGREPAHLKKQRAKAQLGKDAPWGQKKVIDLVAGRSPEEVRSTVNRWLAGFLIGALVLAVTGAFLYSWSIIAGVVLHLLTVVLLVMSWRLFRQRENFVQVAEMVGGR